MKKRTILYILTIILTLFSYNQTVNAAQELTCVYSIKSNEKTMITQDENGKINVYQTNVDSTKEDNGWTKMAYNVLLNEENLKEKLKVCPKYQMNGYPKAIPKSEKISEKISNSELPLIFLYEEDAEIYPGDLKNFLNELEDSSNKVITPKETKELTCKYNSIHKVVLHQFEDGSKKIYITDGDGGYGTSWWFPIKNDLTLAYSLTVTGEKKDYLNRCPRYIDYKNANTVGQDVTYIEFKDDEGSNLIDEQFSIVEMNNIVQTPIDLGSNWLITIDEVKYTGACKYIKILEDSTIHTVQINFGLNNMLITENDPGKGKYSGIKFKKEKTDDYYYKWMLLKVRDSIILQNVLEKYGGECPPIISVDRNADPNKSITDEYYQVVDYANYQIITTIEDATTETPKEHYYYLSEATGKNPKTNKRLSVDGSVKPDFIKQEITSCKQLLGDEIRNIFNVIWNIVKFGIPIILIGLGTLDFVQAVFASKEDGTKKAQSKFIKRLIIAVVIFLIPTLISFILNIANDVWGIFGENIDICGLIF